MAQNFGMSARVGLPLKPLALFMATSGSSLVRSPPWQSAQLSPWAMWTSFLMRAAGPLAASSTAAWQVTQESAAAALPGTIHAVNHRRKRMAGALI